MLKRNCEIKSLRDWKSRLRPKKIWSEFTVVSACCGAIFIFMQYTCFTYITISIFHTWQLTILYKISDQQKWPWVSQPNQLIALDRSVIGFLKGSTQLIFWLWVHSGTLKNIPASYVSEGLQQLDWLTVPNHSAVLITLLMWNTRNWNGLRKWADMSPKFLQTSRIWQASFGKQWHYGGLTYWMSCFGKFTAQSSYTW